MVTAETQTECPRCGSTDTLGPFEMDGIADGVYQVRGLWWLYCRGCSRHTRVPEPELVALEVPA